MRLLPLLVVVAACASPKPSAAPSARWEIAGDGYYAVALCPHCGEPVAHDGTKCAACGADYRIEPTTADCPDCGGTGTVKPKCEACEDTGKCPICQGTGTFEGATCPECEGAKRCGDCPSSGGKVCARCLGKGKIRVE